MSDDRGAAWQDWSPALRRLQPCSAALQGCDEAGL